MYITGKQAQDTGANVTGGRLTVCDSKTMEFTGQVRGNSGRRLSS